MRSQLRYDTIDDEAGVEMVNRLDREDFAKFISVGTPFQIGEGANGNNARMRASGRINFEHHPSGGTTAGSFGRHLFDSGFLMELQAMATPTLTPMAAPTRRNRAQDHWSLYE